MKKKMEVTVSVRLQDPDRANSIKLAEGKRYIVGTFSEAAAVLDKIVLLLEQLPGAVKDSKDV